MFGNLVEGTYNPEVLDMVEFGVEEADEAVEDYNGRQVFRTVRLPVHGPRSTRRVSSVAIRTFTRFSAA